jgi:hypothetical protein
MAIAMGTENKKQVALASVLLAVLILLGGWEIHGAMRSGSAVVRQAVGSHPQHSERMSRKTELTGAEFRLRIHELDRSENMDYTNDGRNIFSNVEPIVIKAPLAPVRPLTPPIPAAVPENKRLPSMDLKYLGFAESNPGKLSALLIRGDDIFLAKTGDIMFHRFRVGTIQTSSVLVTDLTSNITQTIAITN